MTRLLSFKTKHRHNNNFFLGIENPENHLVLTDATHLSCCTKLHHSKQYTCKTTISHVKTFPLNKYCHCFWHHHSPIVHIFKQSNWWQQHMRFILQLLTPTWHTFSSLKYFQNLHIFEFIILSFLAVKIR